MKKIVDLTMVWGTEITPVPGLPSIKFSPLTTHEEHTRSNTKVVFSIHTGTHIDAPYHMVPDGITIEHVPLEIFIGPALVVDVTDKAKSKEPITVDMLKEAGLPGYDVLKDKRLILHSGWAEKHWNKEDFYTANPYIHTETAESLAESGIKAFALDCAVDQGDPFPVHRIFLRKGIPLIENCVNLGALPRDKEFTLIAFPLKVEHGDGSPARVVALVD